MLISSPNLLTILQIYSGVCFLPGEDPLVLNFFGGWASLAVVKATHLGEGKLQNETWCI